MNLCLNAPALIVSILAALHVAYLFGKDRQELLRSREDEMLSEREQKILDETRAIFADRAVRNVEALAKARRAVRKEAL